MTVIIDARQGWRPTGVGEYVYYLLQHASAYPTIRLRPLVTPFQMLTWPLSGLHPIWRLNPGSYTPLLLPHADVAHGPQFSIPPVRASRYVITVHDVFFIQHPEWHPAGFKERMDATMRESLAMDPWIVCDSVHAQETFLDAYDHPRERTTVIRLGCSEDYFPGQHRAGRPRTLLRAVGRRGKYLLHAGALVPRKNIAALLDAFKLLWAQPAGRDLHLVLAGPLALRWSTQLPAIREWRRANPTLARAVHVLGYVRRHELPAIFAHAAAYVCAARDEGFGLPILQAMASSCPVVVGRLPAVREYACEVPWYADPNDPEQFVDAILKAISEPRESPRLSRGGALARELTWSRCAAETFRVYQRAAETGKG